MEPRSPLDREPWIFRIPHRTGKEERAGILALGTGLDGAGHERGIPAGGYSRAGSGVTRAANQGWGWRMAGGAVWFDFENTPHVLFLEPIQRELERAGWTTVCTAKPQSQTIELAERRGISVEVVGGGNLKGTFQ